jgi:hypothetical protein
MAISTACTSQIPRPTTTEQHARFFNRQWSEPDLSGPWIQYHKDRETIDYYNKSTMHRSGEFVGVWYRGDLSEAALSEARRLAAKEKSRMFPVIMEKTLIYMLFDCQRNLLKPRDIRIYFEGRLLAESKYEDENPMNWQVVDPTNQTYTELYRIVCGSKH